jgi:hypothetical protein
MNSIFEQQTPQHSETELATPGICAWLRAIAGIGIVMGLLALLMGAIITLQRDASGLPGILAGFSAIAGSLVLLGFETAIRQLHLIRVELTRGK